MKREAQRWLEEARRRHEVALFLFQAGHYTEALVRAMYVMYAVAQSLLRSEGLSTSTHVGITTLLSRIFVRDGRLDRQFVAFYSQTLRDRLDADYYGRHFSDAAARRRLEQANMFLEKAKEALG